MDLDNQKFQRIIVKIGTSTLTNETQRLSQARMVDIVRQISLLKSAGIQVLLVTSGAIAAGRELLQFPHLPKEIPVKQMLAAVGQPHLIDIWGKLFGIYGHNIAQVLLSRDDLRYRSRYLNARNTLLAILDQEVIPVINEIDTVATEEIRVGDNDNLASLVANLIDADLMMLLTDQDGLYTADPRVDPEAELVKLVDTPVIGEELWKAAGGSGKLGAGGMLTKLQSADLARRSGTTVVIACGTVPDVIPRILSQESIGTRFTPTTSAVESRKRFILAGGQGGKLTVDAGAGRALAQGSSLLAAGLIGVTGEFERGETLSVILPEGREIARGVVNYNHNDCIKLCGRHSSEIESTLGYSYSDVIIHRNNMVLL